MKIITGKKEKNIKLYEYLKNIDVTKNDIVIINNSNLTLTWYDDKNWNLYPLALPINNVPDANVLIYMMLQKGFNVVALYGKNVFIDVEMINHLKALESIMKNVEIIITTANETEDKNFTGSQHFAHPPKEKKLIGVQEEK